MLVCSGAVTKARGASIRCVATIWMRASPISSTPFCRRRGPRRFDPTEIGKHRATRRHAVSPDGPNEIGNEAEFPDDAIDDDEGSPDEQLPLDRKELQELGLELDNPQGFADE